jgi:N-acetylmuramoyl-L-alanine amidase
MGYLEYDDDDIHSMALCVYKEARGEGLSGMQAVAHVIANRVGQPGFAHDLHNVIFGKSQFTSMSVVSDPEFNLIPPPGDNQFSFCQALCPQVLRGDNPDPTFGAKYYYNPKTATSGWFVRVIAGPDGNGTEGHSLSATIGRQRFYL